MAANLQPIFVKDMKFAFTPVILTANIAKDGTGTVNLLATGGVNGSKLDQIKGRATGTNTASVARFFVNNGADPTVATNNALAHEHSLAATTLSEVAALDDVDVTITKNSTETACPIPYLPPSYRLYVVIGTNVAAGWQFSCWSGDY